MHFATKVSDGWLKKYNTTLEQVNQDRGTSLKMGDFIEQSSNISSFDWFMCADMNIIEAQNGEPIYTPEEIYVVTDVQTFSSAFHTAYMLWKMGAMAKTFTPDIQLSYDDYRQFDFSKDAELLFIEKLCSTKKSRAKKL